MKELQVTISPAVWQLYRDGKTQRSQANTDISTAKPTALGLAHSHRSQVNPLHRELNDVMKVL